MGQCLTNQHAVKRVFVNIGQLGQRQSSQSVLDEHFPNGHATEENSGGIILKYFARALGEFS